MTKVSVSVGKAWLLRPDLTTKGRHLRGEEGGGVVEAVVLSEPRRALHSPSKSSRNTAGAVVLFSNNYALLLAGALGARKPAEQAYPRAVQELGVAAERCLFVDDNPDNVEAGRAAGIDSVLYTSPAQLHRELAARGALS